MRDLTILLLACCLAGCTRADDASEPRVASVPDQRDAGLPRDALPPATTPPSDAAAPRVRYRCSDGHRVDLVDDSARVTMRNGTVVVLPRSNRATGTLYAGEALEFTVVGEGAQLAQDEGAHWACTVE